MEKYNCKSCAYANQMEDGNIGCDKKLLLTGKMVVIEQDKIDLRCPAHSDYPTQEWRYDRGHGLLREAEDACCICGRLVNLNDVDTYLVAGNSSLYCKICDDNQSDIEKES